MASQLQPITLLGTDYKLLTKILVARLIPILPSVLRSTQLCSVRGRSIFEGPASILSSAEYLHRHQKPGYLMSLDFFHAYDQVSLPWVDKVMEAMGFGTIFRGWVATLHRDVSAAFLHNISPFILILFSIRQGDPLAALLFVIYPEPFLVRLEANLEGLQVAHFREASFGYMDEVTVLGSHLSDISRVNIITLAFEAAAGALLNRNRKTLILGLGSWAGRQDWPLDWLQSASSIKVLGFDIHQPSQPQWRPHGTESWQASEQLLGPGPPAASLLYSSEYRSSRSSYPPRPGSLLRSSPSQQQQQPLSTRFWEISSGPTAWPGWPSHRSTSLSPKGALVSATQP